MKKSNKPSCFGTQSCGTEEYDGCEFGNMTDVNLQMSVPRYMT